MNERHLIGPDPSTDVKEEVGVRVTEADFAWAASSGFLSKDQAAALWQAFVGRSQGGAYRSPPTPDGVVEARPAFNALNVAYYFGALIVIAAMAFFVGLGWQSFGGAGLFLVGLVYGAAFVAAGRWFLAKGTHRVIGGLFYTMAVCMTPLTVYGLERALGWWPDGDPGAFQGLHVWVRGGWFAIEMATIVVGIVVARISRYPFVLAPVAFAAWYVSMDLSPLIFQGSSLSGNERQMVSIVVGGIMLVAGYVIDLRARQDFAGWLYVFGMLPLWGGLSTLSSDSEWHKLVYVMINVGFIGIGTILRRRVFLVFGGIGIFGYLAYVAWNTFRDSLAFPFVLSGIGLAVIVLAIAYQRRRDSIERAIRAHVPAWLIQLLPPHLRG